jgi:hypothetical protein
MSEEKLLALLDQEGYRNLKKMPSGEWAGIKNMLFTTALVVGLDMIGYRTRFCFETTRAAEASLAKWDGEGFPPGWWIKQKPEAISNLEEGGE